MIAAFLTWFPPCALFVTVAYVTEFSWKQETEAMRRKFVRRMLGDEKRAVVLQEDGSPLMYVE